MDPGSTFTAHAALNVTPADPGDETQLAELVLPQAEQGVAWGQLGGMPGGSPLCSQTPPLQYLKFHH